MDALADEELDCVDNQPLTSLKAASGQRHTEQKKLQSLSATIPFWPFGLVLSMVPVMVCGFRRDCALLPCLQVSQQQACKKTGAEVSRNGVASIRAAPQVSHTMVR